MTQLYQAPTKTTFFRRDSWKVNGILSQGRFSKLREIVVDITIATAALSLYFMARFLADPGPTVCDVSPVPVVL